MAFRLGYDGEVHLGVVLRPTLIDYVYAGRVVCMSRKGSKRVFTVGVTRLRVTCDRCKRRARESGSVVRLVHLVQGQDRVQAG